MTTPEPEPEFLHEPARTPRRLREAGRSFWAEITVEHDLMPHELRLLELACSELDDIDRLADAWADADEIVKGSMGQPVANPMEAAVRQHRQSFKDLIKALSFPVDEETAAALASLKGRKGSDARWHRPGGYGTPRPPAPVTG